jgi:hypothetical protein
MQKIERLVDVTIEMCLAGLNGVIAGFAKEVGELRELFEDGRIAHVKFRRTRIVGIAPCDQAGASRATRTYREIRILEANAARRQTIDMRCPYHGMSVAPEVVERHIVGNEQDDVRSRLPRNRLGE